MNLVMIYGGQATGKLTVGTALSKQIGYKLLHNHLILDLVSSLVPYSSDNFGNSVERVWLEMLQAGIDIHLDGVITTFVYGGPTGAKPSFVHHLTDTIESSGGEVMPVLLTADKQELLKRVKNNSRGRFHKLQDADELSKLLAGHNPTETVSGANSLIIDNTTLPAAEAATRIAEHFRLLKST